MRALVVGVGLQGRAAVHDLDAAAVVGEVVAADVDVAAVEREVARLGCRKVRARGVDAAEPQALVRLVREVAPGVVVCMVPPALQLWVARAALEAGVPFVSTSYAGEVAMLDAEARARGVALLPELGFDPGIDLVMTRAALDGLDEVHGVRTYGGGIPEASASGNPLRYKVSWTFDGVLRSYRRPACLRRDGREVTIPAEEIFRPEHRHAIDVTGLGPLEAYPNGDAVRYAGPFGLGPAVRDLGRYTLRWPGHGAVWDVLTSLGFLGEAPVAVDGMAVPPLRFLARLLEPQLGYGEGERDLAVLRVVAWGLRDGRPRTIVYDMLDARDPATGLYAMNRTVGYTAAIGAELLLEGKLRGTGLLSPARDVPPELLFAELRRRGIEVVRSERAGEEG
ncbi:MAG: saccharopine dehydrogenase NADP-binding domain-containing protein [Deltaproteobacteria bacterium]|nr:saccharopine dehydrogenase NADP-binding domain-containing protein [Deltaproteobacteria bacterium]